MTNCPRISTSRIFLQSQDSCRVTVHVWWRSTPMERLLEISVRKIFAPSQEHWLWRAQIQHQRLPWRPRTSGGAAMRPGWPQHPSQCKRSTGRGSLLPPPRAYLIEQENNLGSWSDHLKDSSGVELTAILPKMYKKNRLLERWFLLRNKRSKKKSTLRGCEVDWLLLLMWSDN